MPIAKVHHVFFILSLVFFTEFAAIADDSNEDEKDLYRTLGSTLVLGGTTIGSLILLSPLVGACEQSDSNEEAKCTSRSFVGGVATIGLGIGIGVPLAIKGMRSKRRPPPTESERRSSSVDERNTARVICNLVVVQGNTAISASLFF